MRSKKMPGSSVSLFATFPPHSQHCPKYSCNSLVWIVLDRPRCFVFYWLGGWWNLTILNNQWHPSCQRYLSEVDFVIVPYWYQSHQEPSWTFLFTKYDWLRLEVSGLALKSRVRGCLFNEAKCPVFFVLIHFT